MTKQGLLLLLSVTVQSALFPQPNELIETQFNVDLSLLKRSLIIKRRIDLSLIKFFLKNNQRFIKEKIVDLLYTKKE